MSLMHYIFTCVQARERTLFMAGLAVDITVSGIVKSPQREGSGSGFGPPTTIIHYSTVLIPMQFVVLVLSSVPNTPGDPEIPQGGFH
jgi:hypothetical protein